MDFLRFKGLPIPEVYGYSLTSENEAGTEYILIEYVEGTNLSDVWFNREKDEIDSSMDQLAKLESNMMSIPFPAGGSIYYARDLKQLSGSEGFRWRGRTRTFCSTSRSGASRSKRRRRASHSTSRSSVSRFRRGSFTSALMYRYHFGMDEGNN